MLESIGPQPLQRIESRPTTRDELATHLINVLEAPLDAPLGDYLDQLLDRLCQIGLITLVSHLIRKAMRRRLATASE